MKFSGPTYCEPSNKDEAVETSNTISAESILPVTNSDVTDTSNAAKAAILTGIPAEPNTEKESLSTAESPPTKSAIDTNNQATLPGRLAPSTDRLSAAAPADNQVEVSSSVSDLDSADETDTNNKSTDDQQVNVNHLYSSQGQTIPTFLFFGFPHILCYFHPDN